MALQLFLSDQYTKKNTTIIVSDPRIVEQCRRVLRYGTGDIFCMQDKGQRYTLMIEKMTGTEINTNIKETIPLPSPKKIIHLAIAMCNKRDKIELIAQKCTEIGVSSVSIFAAHRSVIKQENENKMQRIRAIITEACEQSRGIHCPSIAFVEKIPHRGKILGANMGGKSIQTIENSPEYTVIIGPEGGRDEQKDAKILADAEIISLGSTVLRTETACIVGVWGLMEK